MCIVCQAKEVTKFHEEAIEVLAKSLEEMTRLVQLYCPLAVPSERLALSTAIGLLTDGYTSTLGEAAERSQQAPEGVSADVWAAMPDEIRAVLLAAKEMGGNVQVTNLSDILDEVETKH